LDLVPPPPSPFNPRKGPPFAVVPRAYRLHPSDLFLSKLFPSFAAPLPRALFPKLCACSLSPAPLSAWACLDGSNNTHLGSCSTFTLFYCESLSEPSPPYAPYRSPSGSFPDLKWLSSETDVGHFHPSVTPLHIHLSISALPGYPFLCPFLQRTPSPDIVHPPFLLLVFLRKHGFCRSNDPTDHPFMAPTTFF